jgi:hypothetical protein
MSNRQARRRRVEAVRNGDIYHKAVREEFGRAKAEEVARHNEAQENERNRHREAHERKQSWVANDGPPPLRLTKGRLARLQMIALAMAAHEGVHR